MSFNKFIFQNFGAAHKKPEVMSSKDSDLKKENDQLKNMLELLQQDKEYIELENRKLKGLKKSAIEVVKVPTRQDSFLEASSDNEVFKYKTLLDLSQQACKELKQEKLELIELHTRIENQYKVKLLEMDKKRQKLSLDLQHLILENSRIIQRHGAEQRSMDRDLEELFY